MMIRINLKLKLLLVAIVVAAINADDTDYYDFGNGTEQREFKFPANLPYVNFKNFCKTCIVREVIIRGTFKDMKREDGNFYFNLRLQPNDEDLRTMEKNAMTFALYVRTNTKRTSDYDKKIHGYMNGTEKVSYEDVPSISNLHKKDVTWNTLKHYATYNVGYEFELRIILQPSHSIRSGKYR